MNLEADQSLAEFEMEIKEVLDKERFMEWFGTLSEADKLDFTYCFGSNEGCG